MKPTVAVQQYYNEPEIVGDVPTIPETNIKRAVSKILSPDEEKFLDEWGSELLAKKIMSLI